jgi:hypothetical protein
LLDKDRDPRLAAYVVWVPKLLGRERHVPKARQTVLDARALHYWDDDSLTMRAVRATLQLPVDAWDVYLLYGPGVRWDGDVPPAPALWMHQLGHGVRGAPLDADALAARAEAILHPAKP